PVELGVEGLLKTAQRQAVDGAARLPQPLEMALPDQGGEALVEILRVFSEESRQEVQREGLCNHRGGVEDLALGGGNALEALPVLGLASSRRAPPARQGGQGRFPLPVAAVQHAVVDQMAEELLDLPRQAAGLAVHPGIEA